MASHNLAHITIDDLEIIGYSIAGEETVVAMPQLDVCFDIGKAPDQVIAINHCLISHGHMDHAAGLAYYLSHRNFCGMSEGTVLLPADLVEPVREVLDQWARIDGNQIPANLVGVKPGDEYQIKPNLIARVFPSKHTRNSVGYCIIEKRKKIKPEYANLNSRQIVELKKQGVAIDYSLELPIVSYLGDTQYVDYSQLDYVAKSRILITECTFYEDEHTERAETGKHMHVNELSTLIENMQNEHIILMHTTQRTALGVIRKTLKQNLSAEKLGKVILLMDRKFFK